MKAGWRRGRCTSDVVNPSRTTSLSPCAVRRASPRYKRTLSRYVASAAAFGFRVFGQDAGKDGARLGLSDGMFSRICRIWRIHCIVFTVMAESAVCGVISGIRVKMRSAFSAR